LKITYAFFIVIDSYVTDVDAAILFVPYYLFISLRDTF